MDFAPEYEVENSATIVANENETDGHRAEMSVFAIEYQGQWFTKVRNWTGGSHEICGKSSE